MTSPSAAFFADLGGADDGADGFYERDRLQAHTAMATGAGWGRQFPELLRNGDWHYAVFTPDGRVKPGVSQGSCLACRKPLDADSYVFTLKQLREKAASR